jgi:cytochrome b involved in lipid metabolism
MNSRTKLLLFGSGIVLVLILSGVFLFGGAPRTIANDDSNPGLILGNASTAEPPATTPPVNQTPSEITASVLAQHNSRTDCWVGFQGKVYDVTSYLSAHPGGVRTISSYCGTASFEQAFLDYHGNSQTSTFFRASDLIGNLA